MSELTDVTESPENIVDADVDADVGAEVDAEVDTDVEANATADKSASTDTDTDTDTDAGADTDAEEAPALAPEKVSRIIQAALLATAEPLTIQRLLKLFSRPKPEKELVKALLKEIQEDYAEHDVLRLVQTASGYQFQVADELSPWLLRLWEQKPPRYSRALLETLSLMAYKQPITRGEIEKVRGVAVSNHIIKTLLDRGWVHVVGQREVPGRPCLYATTKDFLDYFNLKRLADLPTLPEIQQTLDAKLQPEQPDEPIQAQLPLADADADADTDASVNHHEVDTVDADTEVDETGFEGDIDTIVNDALAQARAAQSHADAMVDYASQASVVTVEPSATAEGDAIVEVEVEAEAEIKTEIESETEAACDYEAAESAAKTEDCV